MKKIQLSNEIKKECKAMAEAMNKDVNDVEKDIENLIEDNGFPEWGAVAVYKSLHKREMSGIKGVYKFIPLHIGRKNEVHRDGQPMSEVVHVAGMCNIHKDDEFFLTDISLWGTPSDDERADRTKMVEDLTELEKVYSFEGSFNTATNKMSILGTTFEPIPDVEVDINEVLRSIVPVPIAAAEDHINETSFYKGFVGRVMYFDDSDTTLLELSDALATPITCWLNDTQLEETEWLGHSAVVLASSSKPPQKEVRLNGMRAWKSP